MKLFQAIKSLRIFILITFLVVGCLSPMYSASRSRVEFPAFDSAQNYLNRLMPDLALEILLEIADTVELSSDIGVKTRIAIAEAFRSLREYDKGIVTLYEVLEVNEISNYNKAHAFNRMAALYNEKKPNEVYKFDSVIKYSEKCITLAEENSYPNLLASSNNELGFIYFKQNNYQLSEDCYRIALQLFIELEDMQHAVNVSINLSNNYISREMFDEAHVLIDSAFNYITLEEYENSWMRLYLQLAKINEFQENWEDAYYALSQGRLLQVKQFNGKLDEAIFEMSAKYELDKQQLKLIETERRSKARLRDIFLLAIILIITVILFAISYRSFVLKLKNKSQNEVLQKLEKQRLKDRLSFEQRELSTEIANSVAYNQIMIQVKNAILKNEVKAALNIINSNIDTHKNWRDFLVNFKEMYPDFFSRLIKDYPDLSETEQKLSAMLLMGLKSKEIAGVLNIELSSVSKARNRLRKKINLDSDQDFSNFFCQFVS